MFAEIIIPLALPKNYTWFVPEQFHSLVQPGVRVEVGLGKNKKYAGIIAQLHEKTPPYETKEILNVLDQDPVVFPDQLQLWRWVAEYYMCTEGEVMAAALPAHFKLSSETIIVFNEEAGDDFSALDNDEFLIAEALSMKKELRMSELQQIVEHRNIYPLIKKLMDQKICFVWESLKETYTPKKETFVVLDSAYLNEDKLADLLNNWTKAPKQMELLLSYLHISKTQGEVTKSELLKKSGASDAQLKGLVEKNILSLDKRRVDRIRYLPMEVKIDFDLSAAQQAALADIRKQFELHSVCLLHGVTSSGKTQIYISLIEQYIRQGKQVLYLLPEIALTAQIIRRLEKHFGGYIGIYHSKFSQNERVEIWNRIRRGELKVVLGARSALFLPFSDLGLIVVDEEHDTSYKQQDPAPRYHARDTAIYLASTIGANVLLGSATPSVDSYYNCITGKYGLVNLNERFGGMDMPEMTVIDTRIVNQKTPEKTIVSSSLEKEIHNSLEHKKQVILFQNRRGYTPYQVCRVCGWIPHCRNCDVALTFHKRTQKLHCHYCGQLYPPVHSCQACGSDQFVQRNFGTEKIEEQLEELFPGARVARMDIDSVRGKNAHDTLIKTFEQGKIDILVGTQMVVKGLDFDNVELVGVLDADSLLNFADYRVNERAFQLIEQVSGRAGRKDKRGKVAIQIANTRHPLLEILGRHDYQEFFEKELEGRKKFFYPPFSRTILLTFKHKQKPIVDAAADWFAARLRNKYGQYIVGPAEPVVNRIRDQYLMEILLKLPRDSGIVKDCKKYILEQVAAMHSERQFRNIVLLPDVDK